MPIHAQFNRDLLCGVIIAAFTYLFFLAISDYLSGLQKPLLLTIAFGISLMVSSVFEIRHHRGREGIAAVAPTAILFAAGVLLAHYLRHYYINLLAHIDDIKGAAELIGPEYLSLASSKVIGYGGAYGFGLILVRLIGRTSLLNLLTEHLILPEYRTETCHHCQQEIP